MHLTNNQFNFGHDETVGDREDLAGWGAETTFHWNLSSHISVELQDK